MSGMAVQAGEAGCGTSAVEEAAPRITQTTVQKTFTVEYKGVVYFVDYLNSDGQILGLINRDNLEVRTEDGEEFNDYVVSDASPTEMAEAQERAKTIKELILHVIEHFNDFDAKLAEEFEDYRTAVEHDGR